MNTETMDVFASRSASPNPATRIHRRILIYWLTAAGLAAAYAVLRGATWQGTANLHTGMETVATILALMAGLLLLRRWRRVGGSLPLILGVGFIGTGFLDGYHALVTSAAFKHYLPSDLSSLIPWSWIASRLYLSLLLLMSIAVWRREQRLGAAGRVDTDTIFLGCIALTLLSFLFFSLVPLPPAYYPEILFHRPEEFVPAIFFGIALSGYLRKGDWRHDVFEHWLVLALIINLVAQVVFMSFSGRLFDFEFDAAHMLKKLSYMCVLCGLVWSHLQGSDRRQPASLVGGTPHRGAVLAGVSFGIARQIVLMISLIVVGAVAVTTSIVWVHLRTALYHDTAHSLEWQGRLVAQELQAMSGKAAATARYFAAAPPVQFLVAAGTNDERASGKTQRQVTLLGDLLRNVFDVFPLYRSIRVLGRIDGEWANVAAVARSPDDTRSLGSGIGVRRWAAVLDDMSVTGEHQVRIIAPTAGAPAVFYVAMPIQVSASPWAGLIVIELDFARVLAELARFEQPDVVMLLLDAHAALLAPADMPKSKSELRSLIRQLAHTGIESASSNTSSAKRRHLADGRTAVVHERRVELEPANGSASLHLVLAADPESTLIGARASGRQALTAAAIVTGVALLVGWWFGRALIGPLRHIAQVSAAYGKGSGRTDLPVAASDEIGVVARALSDMINQIEARTAELEREVSERTQAQSRLAEKSVEIERSNEELGQFAYVASHDLQEPLRTVTSFVQLLRKKHGGELGEDADRYIQHAIDGCDRMKCLIKDLLTYSRIGGDTVDHHPVDSAAVLDQCLSDLTTAIDDAGAQVSTGPLPRVIADESQLRTLLQNLIVNALKYRGETVPEISIGARQVDDECEFFVTDNGIGIESEYFGLIFGVFQRLHGRGEYEGTGVGL